jgi:flagellar hook-associated protein 3 FlgL
MRVSFQTGFFSALADIQRTSEDMLRAQQEVSSGKRIQVPSDDPLAASGAVTESAAIASIDRYSRTVDSVTSRLSVVDTVLGDVIDKLTEAQTAATGALGDTATTAQREAAARELAGIRDALYGDLNTNYRGVYLFAGTASTTSPFQRNPDDTVGAYQGNTSTISVDIDRSSSVQITFDGSTLTQGTDPQDVFATIENLRSDILAGNTPNIQSGLDALKRAFDRATKMQTEVGTDEKALTDQQSRLSTETLGAQARLSKLQDANMAEAISALSRAQTGYQAALGAASTISKTSLMDYLP